MRCPAYCDTAFWTTQSSGYPLLSARQDKGQRSWPKSGSKRRSVAREMQPETSDHLAIGHQKQKWLSRRASLEVDERLDGPFIDLATQSIHGLGWIREHFAGGQMHEGSVDGSLDFLRRPERYDHRLRLHSRKILSASARAKSFSSVILSARSLPRTTITGRPICSQSAASSVATRSASPASRCARSITARGKACGV